MKKNYLFLATAAVLMASCANDDFSGDNTSSPTGTGAIAFNMNTPAMSRATESGQNAATKLGNEFIVWGEKNEGSDSSAGISDLANNSNVVFENYRVSYSGTANSTTSNTNGWEYVGITPYNSNGSYSSGDGSEATAKVSPSIYASESSKQTIKYWDDEASSYTFTAVSAKQSDIKKQLVKITKNYSQSTAATKGYTIELGSDASTGNIYYADRNNVTKTDGKFSHKPVTMTFRNFQSKIRFGIYETVPGYKVVITGIKYGGAERKGTSTDGDKYFGVEGNFIKAGDNTKYKVTYVASGSNQNRAQVELVSADNVTPAHSDTLQTGGQNWLSTSWTNTTTNNCVGEAANDPTYDWTTGSGSSEVKGAYTSILPNPSNSKELKLTIKYDLYSEDTGEKISVDYKTVTVPAEYCQWKSNYAYTYLFKISDKSAELYPITFDACVVTEDNGNWESITEVSEPSITTFAVTSTSDKTIVTGKNEYEAGNIIYATVYDGTSLATLSSDNTKLYTVTATGTQIISEASVANCLVNGTKNQEANPTTWTATAGTNNVLTVTLKSYTAASDLLNKVPSEDGNDVTLAESDKKALKWTAESGTTYAIEFTKDSKQYYKIVKVASSN